LLHQFTVSHTHPAALTNSSHVMSITLSSKMIMVIFILL
jgi:hypothetical protein